MNDADASAVAARRRQLLLQQQPLIMRQHQLPQSHLSRFAPAADLAGPGPRSLHPQHPLPPPPPPQQAAVWRCPVEVEMAWKDALQVCNPDVVRPFASVEDAVHRLLPYHVVADYEAEEDDINLDSDAMGQTGSRLQQWDQNLSAKVEEYVTAFEKQMLASNIMSRKRALGEFRAEERLMLEWALLQEEKHARAKAEAYAEVARGPMRAGAFSSPVSEAAGLNTGRAQGNGMEEFCGWQTVQRED